MDLAGDCEGPWIFEERQQVLDALLGLPLLVPKQETRLGRGESPLKGGAIPERSVVC